MPRCKAARRRPRRRTSVRRGADDEANAADGRFSARIIVVIVKHPVLGALDVVEFPLFHGPEKDQPAAAAEKER
jgi:hypothetical protein